MYDYITIERSYASGGKYIAEKLGKRLNYRVYDNNVVMEASRKLNMPYQMISGMDEQAAVKTLFTLPGNKYTPLEDQIFDAEKEIIREAANEPGCIFIGRCASQMLKDRRCLRVFITAPVEFRTERAIKVEHLSPDNVEGAMHRFDTRREKYFTAHAGERWGKAEYFDIVLNSGELGIDACVDILEAAAKTLRKGQG